MSIDVRRVPVEEQLKTWHFPLYPANRAVQPTRNTQLIPSIEGRGFRLDGRDQELGSCYICSPTRSRPSSSSSVRNILLRNSTSILFPNSRFNERLGSGRSRKETRPRRMTVDGRTTPLALECLQTNLRNHTQVGNPGNHSPLALECLRNHSQSGSATRTNECAVTRTILEDRQLNRSNSLPILLEKKSVEMKPRYPPKQVKLRPGPAEEQEEKEPEKAEEKETKQPVLLGDPMIDHTISVTITDKRTRSVVRASSARAQNRTASSARAPHRAVSSSSDRANSSSKGPRRTASSARRRLPASFSTH